MKKKILFIIGFIVLAIVICLLFLMTDKEISNVYLKDYEVSNNKIILKIDSNNYIKKYKEKKEDSSIYYNFYSNGFNLKSKDTFELEVSDDINKIYLYTNDGYKLVLVKVIDTWKKVSYADNENIKISLPNVNEINKLIINTTAQNNNYFEYTDKSNIEKVYNIFNNLETDEPSITYNPSDDIKELYVVSFDTNLEEKYYFSVYKQEDKYYIEQSYNGIYAIKEEEYNIIKSYVK